MSINIDIVEIIAINISIKFVHLSSSHYHILLKNINLLKLEKYVNPSLMKSLLFFKYSCFATILTISAIQAILFV